MSISKNFLTFILISFSIVRCSSQRNLNQIDKIPYPVYPQVNQTRPDLPSPFITKEGKEYVIAVTKEDKFAIIEVTPSNSREICKQLIVDTLDFPQLAQKGLHSEKYLDKVKTISGWDLAKINEFGRPNGLSKSGFMESDENIISVIKGDNRIVSKLGLTHPQLAKPLFHVLNMMDTDLSLNRWNMAKHRWENIASFYYNNHKVFVEAGDTKGGQKSLFNDNIEGGFYIRLWREFDSSEIKYLEEHYNNLSTNELYRLKDLLSIINIGEMEPQYIMRYGFYEGHTYWRADPIALSLIFGFRSLEEIDRSFEGKLLEILTTHFTE